MQGDIRNSNINIRRTVYYNKPTLKVRILMWMPMVGGSFRNRVRKVHVELGDPIILYATDSIETMYTYVPMGRL
jgi:hypothetical protein